jgi:hypothetical protein
MFLGYYLNYLPSYTSVGSEFKMYSKMNLIKKNLFLNGGNENNRTYDVCHHNLDCTIFVLRCFPPLLFSNMILKSCFLAMLMFTMLPFCSMQFPKPLNFFLGAQSDEKGVKQIIRLILSKFIRRQPGRSDSEWASMWHKIFNIFLCMMFQVFETKSSQRMFSLVASFVVIFLIIYYLTR